MMNEQAPIAGGYITSEAERLSLRFNSYAVGNEVKASLRKLQVIYEADRQRTQAALVERDARIAALTAERDALKDELIASLKEEIEQRNIAGLRTGVEVARLRLLTERKEGDE